MKEKRHLVVEFALFLFAALCIGRLFYWQILRNSDFATQAKAQTESVVNVGAERGKILASDGSILVSNQKAYLVYAILTDIKKLKAKDESFDDLTKRVADQITPVILEERLSYQEDLSTADKGKQKMDIWSNLVFQLRQPDVVWVPLAKKIEEQTKEKIKTLNIKGIGFQDDTKRFYPEGDIGATLFGFVAKDSLGNDKGYSGLEGFYDDQLKGKSGQLVQEVDALGHPILIASSQGRGALDGKNLETTIDRSVQYTVENKLKDGVKKYGAAAGVGIVLDVKTGGILAMSSYPSFNPQDPSVSADESRNLGISEVYEPGSTFKSVTVSSAIDHGDINATTICPCDGPIKIAGYEIQTWNNKYHPNSTIAEVLQHSDNVGAAFAAGKLGKSKFIEYIKNFGFGQSSGVGLQGEESGILKNKSDWGDIDLVTGAFGQGLSVTALQMVNAVGAIANNGQLMKPYVVKKISGDKTQVTFEPKKLREVIKPETASTMKELLLSAVENGEAKRIIPHGYRVGGKTGTAQVPIAGHYSNKTVASFVGFGPVENPKFAMIVVLFQPSASIFAADTAEPLFFNIVKDLYPYWGIPVHQ